MRMRTGSWSSGALVALGVIVMAGCGASPESDAPPFDELPLREALGADPSVIATLPADARARLRDRFIAAATLPEEDKITASDMSAPTVEKRVRTVDAVRERDGHDSYVLAVLDERGGRGVPIATVVNAPTAAIVMEQSSPNAMPATHALETAALREEAGALVETLARASSAHHVARKTGWPVAAVAEGDTVYVNAAWLVAMAPDDAEVPVSAPPPNTPIASKPSPQPAADPVVEDEPLDDGGTDEPAGAALRDTWKEPCSAACDREANSCTQSCSDSCSKTCSQSCPKCRVSGRREHPTPLGMLRSFALLGLAFLYVGISARRSKR